jgi:hypothetical protein
MFEGDFGKIQSLMNEKESQIEKIQNEWRILDSARKIYLAATRQHYEFQNLKDLKAAMRRNFNPFDTFSLKKGKRNENLS